MAVRSRLLWGPERQTATLAPTTADLYTVPDGRTLVLRSILARVGGPSGASPRLAIAFVPPGELLDPEMLIVRAEPGGPDVFAELVGPLSISLTEGVVIKGICYGGSIIPTVGWSMGSGSLLSGNPE